MECKFMYINYIYKYVNIIYRLYIKIYKDNFIYTYIIIYIYT